MIYIHRPFISRQGSRSFPSSANRGYLHARKVCIESATAISALLRIYRNTWTLRYMNIEVVSIIFSAAIILIFESVTSPIPCHQSSLSNSLPLTRMANNSSNSGAIRSPGGTAPGNNGVTTHLDTCCKALADLGRVFQNATRTLEVLLVIKRKWQAELLASTGSKRRGSTTSRPVVGCKKRTISYPHEPGVAV